ncbi:unnamed protein product [Somion occarium]|uniref:SANT domain-containing protein n=1 Tax=Somion occarium TaxID=3059160 RepID=A0ABP1CWX8_9APHY
MYDRYTPARSGRDEYSSTYRPDTWRHPRSYYERTPSPEHYPRQRSETWSHSDTWRGSEPSAWAERRSPQYSTFEESSSRGRRDIPSERLFEPSDNWKQSHGSSMLESPVDDRVRDWPQDSHILPPRERSSDAVAPREPYPAPYYSETRYRPYSPTSEYREPYPPPPPPANHRYDSYRPSYPERGTAWIPHSPVESRASHLEPRRERSFTHPMPPNARSESFDRSYATHERSFSAGSPPDVGSTSPGYRGSISGVRAPVKVNHDIYEDQADYVRPSPTGSTFPSHQMLRSRSSSRSSEFRKPPRLEVSIPNGSFALSDVADFSAEVDRHTDFRNRMPARSPDQEESVGSRKPPSPTALLRERSPRSDVHDESRQSPTFYQRSPQLSTNQTLPQRESTPLGTMERSPPITPPPMSKSPSPNLNDVSLVLLEEPGGQVEEAPLTSLNAGDLSQGPPPITPFAVTMDHAKSPREANHNLPAPSVGLTPPESRTHMHTPFETLAVETPPSESQRPPSQVVPTRVLHQPVENEKSLHEALQMIVMMRLRCDRQTREERVDPVLLANRSIAEPPRPYKPDSLLRSDSAVVQEIVEGPSRKFLENSYAEHKPSLEVRFAQRQADLNEKLQRIREEYLSLHERWLVHCAKLDEVAKAGALEEAAATAGRTTRRSTTTLGDAVRSDLEMEQIIASLGNEELTDATHLGARNAAVIPDMVSATKGDIEYIYDDTNNEVLDPRTFFAPRTGFKDWTEEEKKIFLEKYAQYPKQFGIIADFLPDKTPAQCVTYYYLHKKKHIDFRKVVSSYTVGKRRRGGRRAPKKRGNALLSDILKRDAEVSREPTPTTSAGRRTKPVVATTGEGKKPVGRRQTSHLEDTPTPTSTPDPEGETRRKRRRVTTARAQAALEQEAVLDEIEEQESKLLKRGRRGRKPKAAAEITSADSTATPSEGYHPVQQTRFIDQTEMIARRKAQQAAGVWSEEDKAQFLTLLSQYGDDFKRIAASMPNKTTIQVSAFYKCNQAELNLAHVAASAPKRSPSPEGTREGWSTYPGSMTPNSSAVATPPEGAQMSYNGTTLETRFRVNPMAHFPGEIPNYQFHSTTPETMQAQYRQPDAHHHYSHTQLQATPIQPTPQYPPYDSQPMMAMRMSMGYDHIANPSPFAQSAPLTTTFPSAFPYTNLSPSHFAGGGRPPPISGIRGGIPPHHPNPPPTYVHPGWAPPANDMQVYRG